MSEQFDFIVVGAGSAGCVLANRLSACGKYSVCLLEAGGSDWRFFVQVPIGYGKTYYQRAVNWMFHTENEPGLGNRPSYWPRGKVLGGSSSINAMVYIRGHRQDYDDWAAAGNPGWSYEEVLPYFIKSEGNAQGDSNFHGRHGPLRIDDQRAQMHPLIDTFKRAGAALGLPVSEDFNGAQQSGIGAYQCTIHRGRRMSASRAFLRPAMKRPNLTVITRAHTTRVLFEDKRAVGVEYKRAGKLQQVFAQREVVLSAGAVNSPQLLMLSGVGASEALQSFGIDVVHQSPAVGQHLQDHLGIDLILKTRIKTLNDTLHPWWGKLLAGVQYLTTLSGPLSLSLNQGGGFVRTQPELKQPNVQLYCSPLSYTRAPAKTRPLMNPDPFSAFMLGLSNCRPQSTGSITLRSADPFDDPIIHANYFSAPEDMQELIAGTRYLRQMVQTDAMQEVVIEELVPGESVQSEEQLEHFIRQSAWTVFHPCCSCRMGPDPATNVVDAQLRIHGLQNIRVADASIFPHIVSGNTNAPCMMVAEKASDMILQDTQNPNK